MPPTHRNVLFIICHDSGPYFGCYGDRWARTPHIDRLALTSLRFDHHYCHMPLCGPSRATIFTGCRPATTQRFDNLRFFPDYRERTGFATLPELLARHGYATRSVGQVMHGSEEDAPSWTAGQWHPPPLDPLPDWATARGLGAASFNHYREQESLDLMQERVASLEGRGVDPHVEVKRWRGPAVEAGRPAPLAHSPYPEEATTESAVASLGELSARGSPFFLGVGYDSGHLPLCAPAAYFDLHRHHGEGRGRRPAQAELPVGAPPFAVPHSEPSQYYTMDLYDKPWRHTEQQGQELIQGHYAAISYFDAQVGRLLDALDATGAADNTVVVLTTDHGFSLGEHAHFGKKTHYELDLRVPLLIRAPGRRSTTPAAAATSALTEHVDLYPTICELCSVSAPDQLEGRSNVPLLADPALPGKRAVFAEIPIASGDIALGTAGDATRNTPARPTGHHGYSVRTERHRYVRYEDRDGITAEELYDLQADPNESRNLAGDPSYADRKREIEELLDRGWLAAA